jgi:hypothetical protein
LYPPMASPSPSLTKQNLCLAPSLESTELIRF